MYTRDQGEEIVLVFRIDSATVTLTGAEPTKCQLRKVGVDKKVAPGATVALTLTGVYTAAAGAEPAKFTFTGSSETVAEGVYAFGAWVEIAGKPVSLEGGFIKINKNPSDLP